MRLRVHGRLIAIATLLSLSGIDLPGETSVARATEIGADVDLDYFYDELAPYGDWRDHPRWGWVWYPRNVGVDWRPYTLGHWAYTDEFGWLWESDEDWGWATFHYGRWDWDDNFGWYWAPGYHWGPGWVAWRTSPGYIGWCPLPPEARWEPGFGLQRFDWDDLPPRRWTFVESRFFDAPRLHDHLLLVSRNVGFFDETRPVVRFEDVRGRIVDRGFSDVELESFIHRPIPHYHVRYVDSAPAMRLDRDRDGEVPVFTPRIRPGPAVIMPPQRAELQRRQNAEWNQLQERQREEQTHQFERHQAEREAQRTNELPLLRRQEAERRELQSEHDRQRRVLQNRQMQQREEFQRSGTVPPRDGRPGRR
ncbi:MAG: DUF6600 domain-containing protein [Solirubrobacterales bacterium]